MQKFWKKFRLSEPARTARSEPVERLEIEIMSADGAGVSTALIRPGIHAGYIKVQAPIGFPHTVQAELGSDHAFLIRGAVDSAVGHGRKLPWCKNDFLNCVGESLIRDAVQDYGSHGNPPFHRLVSRLRVDSAGEPVEVFFYVSVSGGHRPGESKGFLLRALSPRNSPRRWPVILRGATDHSLGP